MPLQMKTTYKTVKQATANMKITYCGVMCKNVCIFHLRRIWQCLIVHMGTWVLCVYGWVANSLLLHTE